MDLRRLRIGEYLLAVAGTALLVSLFLPWYAAVDTLSAWEALGAIDVIVALLAGCAVSVTVVTAVQRVAAVPIALDAIATLLGIVAFVLVLFRVIDLPGGASGREGGVWLALVAAAGIVVGGALAMRDERISSPERPTDATGRPIAKRPEVEPLPAPPRGSAP